MNARFSSDIAPCAGLSESTFETTLQIPTAAPSSQQRPAGTPASQILFFPTPQFSRSVTARANFAMLRHHNPDFNASRVLFLMQIEKTSEDLHPRSYLAVLLLLHAIYLQADDSLRFKSLAQRVAENEKRNRLLEMSYVYEVTRQKISLGNNSEALESESHTFEVTPLEEGDYRRLIKKDGQPLSEKEARKEQEKLDQSVRKHSSLAKSERENLEKKRNERRRKEEQLWDEGLKAFDLALSGEEHLDGRKTLIFIVTPRAGYIPRDSDLKDLETHQRENLGG